MKCWLKCTTDYSELEIHLFLLADLQNFASNVYSYVVCTYIVDRGWEVHVAVPMLRTTVFLNIFDIYAHILITGLYTNKYKNPE